MQRGGGPAALLRGWSSLGTLLVSSSLLGSRLAGHPRDLWQSTQTHALVVTAVNGKVDSRAVTASIDQTEAYRHAVTVLADCPTTATSSPCCRMPLCNCHEVNSPLYYVMVPGDAVGHKFESILIAFIAARRHKLRLAGFHNMDENMGIVDGHDFFDVVDRLFGYGSIKEMFAEKKHPDDWYDFHPASLKTWLDSGNQSVAPTASRVLITTADVGALGNPETWPSGLRGELAQNLRQVTPLSFSEGALAVAMHVRRGDLGKHQDKHKRRFTPDQYFIDLIDMIRRFDSAADIHVFSSTKNKREHGKFKWRAEEFNNFTQAGVRLHLDDSDLLVPWAHMARAHVFVMDWSAFSNIPAWLNPNCVISNIRHEPAMMWEKRVAKDVLETKLRECVRRLPRGAAV